MRESADGGGARSAVPGEDRRSIVRKLRDRLADVIERAMCLSLGGRAGQGVRIPAPAELLDARHVDRAVVQELLDLAEMRGKKTTVRADGVAAQRHRSRFADVSAEEVERLRGR